MSTTKTKILLVEDDDRIRRELLDSLRASGFSVDIAVSVSDATVSMNRQYDLVLLDLGLPDGDGLDLCRTMRGCGRSVPIIVLTARDSPQERVRGLDVGADDYVTKPFHMPELIARIRSVLRRAGRSVGPGRIQWGAFWCDPDARLAGCENDSFDLKPRELDLFLFFLRHPERTWTRDQLLDRVWGSQYDGDTRTVDLHVRRLRAKIEDDPGDPRCLRTVWGVGYRFEKETDDV